MEPVRSSRNAKVAAASRLHRVRDRRSTGLTLIEGPHVLGEAVAAAADVRRVFALAEDALSAQSAAALGADLVVVDQVVLHRLAPTETPRGPVAVLAIPDAEVTGRDVVVSALADPGNAGTIVRTAAAFGLDVVAAPGSVDLWSPKVLRAGAGAHFRTRIGSHAPESSIATVVEGGIPPSELRSVLDPDVHWSVLIGSEAHGLASDVVAAAKVRVTIPMPGGIESLNAAVAGAIVMYELARWRGGAGWVSPSRPR